MCEFYSFKQLKDSNMNTHTLKRYALGSFKIAHTVALYCIRTLTGCTRVHQNSAWMK